MLTLVTGSRYADLADSFRDNCPDPRLGLGAASVGLAVIVPFRDRAAHLQQVYLQQGTIQQH